MCGRARASAPGQQVAQQLDVPMERFRDANNYVPMPNAYPGVYLPVLYQDDDGKPSLRPMAWGLVPSFTKKDGPINHFFCFNARSESVADKSMFKRLLNKRRCIVVVDGFYEWRAEAGKKRPYFVHPSGRPLLLAALYDVYCPSDQQQEKLAASLAKRQKAFAASQQWTVDPSHAQAREQDEGSSSPGQADGTGPDKDGTEEAHRRDQHEVHSEGEGDHTSYGADSHGSGNPPLYSVSILTCPPCGSLAWLHDRMPCILPSLDAARAWIDCARNPWAGGKAGEGTGQPMQPSASLSSSPVHPQALLQPYAGTDLQWHACTRRMNTLAYQHVDASKPVDPATDDAQDGGKAGSKRGKGAMPSPGKGQGTLLSFLQGGKVGGGAAAGVDKSKVAEATGRLGTASSPGTAASSGRKRGRDESGLDSSSSRGTAAKARPGGTASSGTGGEEADVEEVVELLE